jgi:hypothetical protein
VSKGALIYIIEVYISHMQRRWVSQGLNECKPRAKLLPLSCCLLLRAAAGAMEAGRLSPGAQSINSTSKCVGSLAAARWDDGYSYYIYTQCKSQPHGFSGLGRLILVPLAALLVLAAAVALAAAVLAVLAAALGVVVPRLLLVVAVLAARSNCRQGLPHIRRLQAAGRFGRACARVVACLYVTATAAAAGATAAAAAAASEAGAAPAPPPVVFPVPAPAPAPAPLAAARLLSHRLALDNRAAPPPPAGAARRSRCSCTFLPARRARLCRLLRRLLLLLLLLLHAPRRRLRLVLPHVLARRLEVPPGIRVLGAQLQRGRKIT